MAFAAASTRSRTSARTSSGRLKTLEAVAFDTPARSATSLSRTAFSAIRSIVLPRALLSA